MEYQLVTIVDNFFDDLPSVIHLAETLEYGDPEGTKFYPGDRTACLSIAAPEFYASFCPRLFEQIYDMRAIQAMRANITVYFQRIESFSPDANDPLNDGWIHQDLTHLSGIVYLNSHPGGTNINRPLVETPVVDSTIKYNFFNQSEDHDPDAYRESIIKHKEQFTPTIQVENVPNRLFLFSGSHWHNVTTFHGDNPRYTLVFFLHQMHINTYPQQNKEIFVKDHWFALEPC